MKQGSPKTVEIYLSNIEFEKLKTVKQLDRVVFLNEELHECFTVYDLVSDNSNNSKTESIEDAMKYIKCYCSKHRECADNCRLYNQETKQCFLYDDAIPCDWVVERGEEE